MNVTHLVASFGYGAVFLLVAAESLGLPLPGETTLIAAAAYAGRTHHLSVWAVFAVAAAAAICGDNAGYLVGWKGGYRLARRFGPRLGIGERRLKVGRYLFDRHGPKVVFVGRFVSILRMTAAFLAGTNRMRWRGFLAANASGGVLWAGAYTSAAYVAGSSLRHLSGEVNLLLVILALLVAVATLLAVRQATERLAGAAEAAYPGPLE